jgi:dihydrofolate reductase
MTVQYPRNLKWIVAATPENGIGINGSLPWRLTHDMQFFTHLTRFYGRSELFGEEQDDSKPLNACIMGRKTWESIPQKFRPLPGRINIVLSRSTFENEPNVIFVKTLEEALEWIQNNKASTTWVIGGAQLYQLALPFTDQIYLTRVRKETGIQCDTFLDFDLSAFERVSDAQYIDHLGTNAPLGPHHEKGFHYEFQIWNRR